MQYNDNTYFVVTSVIACMLDHDFGVVHLRFYHLLLQLLRLLRAMMSKWPL